MERKMRMIPVWNNPKERKRFIWYVILMILSIIGYMALVIPKVSALEFDNVKSNYDSVRQEVTVRNGFGIGTKVATLTLNTPRYNYVPAGTDIKVAQITIDNREEYINALQSIRYHKLDGLNSQTKEFTYKVLSYDTVTSNLTTIECGKINCTEKIVGTYTREIERWTPIEGKSLPKGNITIGIFTNTIQGEIFDWIPTWYGVEIEECAIVSVTETIQGGAWGTDSLSNARGWQVNLTAQINVTAFILENSATATRALIRSQDNSQTLFSSTNKVGQTIFFSGAGANLSVGNYRFLADASGATYDGRRLTGETLPQSTGRITWSLGANEGTNDDGFSILSVVYNTTINNINDVALTNPADHSNFTSLVGKTLNMTANMTAGSAINATAYIYNSAGLLIWTNFTDNLLVANKANFTIPTVLTDGTYNWTGQMGGNDGASVFAPRNFTFRIDSTSPSVRTSSPANETYVYPGNSSNTQFVLNISATDATAGVSATYWNSSWDSTVRLVVNNARNTINITNIFGQHSIFVFSNDSFGNMNMNQTSIIIPKPLYNLTAAILTTEGFVLNSSYFRGLTATSVSLNYNNTIYSPAITTDSAGNTIASTSIDLPLANGTIKFFWNTTLSDGSRLNSSIYNQTISSISLDNCAVHKNLIVNFTNFDQDSLIQLPNNTFNIQVRVGDDDLNNYVQYANNASLAWNLQVCMDINLTRSYRMDLIMQWSRNSSYFTQFYNIQNYTLTNQTINQTIQLYNLLQANGQVFNILIKDQNYLPLQDALVQIDRQYVQNGNFLTVEIPKTDSQGSTVGHLILNNQLYNIYIKKNNKTIATFLSQQPYCNPLLTDCVISYNLPGNNINPTTLDGNNNIFYTASYNDSSRVYKVQYTSVNGTAITVVLNGSYSGSQVCSGIQTASAGSVSCIIPAQYQNRTVTIQGYSNGKLIFTDYVNVGYKSRGAELSKVRFLMVGLLLPAVVLMLAGSGSIALIMFIFGLVISAFVFLIDTQSILGVGSFIIWFAIGAIVLIIKIAKGGQKNG